MSIKCREKITLENMHRIAAILRFKVEEKLGHSIPINAIYASTKEGAPKIFIKNRYWDISETINDL